jgi:hypothetical protein
MSEVLTPEERKAIYLEWLTDKVNYDEDALIQRAEAAVLRKCGAEVERLRGIVDKLTLATSEGDDRAMGTHYVAKDGVIRCKGSFLALIENARAALKGGE